MKPLNRKKNLLAIGLLLPSGATQLLLAQHVPFEFTGTLHRVTVELKEQFNVSSNK